MDDAREAAVFQDAMEGTSAAPRTRMPDPPAPAAVQFAVIVKGIPAQATAREVAAWLADGEPIHLSGTPLLSYDSNLEAIVPLAGQQDVEAALKRSRTLMDRE
jgi:hypothetical protein